MNRPLATLTRILAAMTIVFASLVLMPVGDAVACSPESAVAQMAISVDVPNDAAGQSTEKSSLCSHGHCHHAVSDRLHMAEVTPPYLHDLVVSMARERVNVTAAPEGLLRPPRT
jgi:hypothetical protein